MKSRITITVVVLLALSVVFAGVAPAKETPPPPEKPKKVSFPKFKEFTTDNGMEAIVVEHKEQPIVTLYVIIKAGSALDPDGRESLAGFVDDQLNKGTTSKDALELAEWIESVGGNVITDVNEEFIAIGVTILKDYVDTAFEYLADVLRNPVFPQDELEIIRKRSKTGLEFELSDPAAMAQRHLRNLVYGDHPYSKQPTVESIEAITRDDLVSWHKRNVVPNNILFSAVGDVKWKDVRKALENHFGDWQPGTPDELMYASAPAMDDTKIYLYHRPASVQTQVWVGHLGLEGKSGDWAAVEVANRILGAGSEGRLFQSLREEHGWTYGAYSSFDRSKDIGTFDAHAAVRTEVTDSALVELLSQLEKIKTEPVSADDLDHAKSYLIGSFPLTIETPGQIAGQIGRYKLLGLGKEDLESYRDRVGAVTIEDVQRVMSDYLHPERAYVVLVGDATSIEDKVSVVADVSLYDIAGEPMSLAALAVTAVDYEYDTSGLRDMSATYGLTVQSMAIGDLNVSVKKTKDVIEVKSNLTGMVTFDERMEFNAMTLAPISYKRTMQMGPQTMGSEFAFTDTGGSGKVQGQQSPEPKEVTFDLVDGTIMDGAIEYAIGSLPLGVNKEYRVPVVDSESGSLQNLTAIILEVVDVETPAGSFAAYKIKLDGPNGEAYMYLGKDNPHLMIKTEVPAQMMSIELKSLAAN